jgi:hypothetical protein
MCYAVIAERNCHMSDSKPSYKRSRLEIAAEKAVKANSRLRELKEQKRRRDRKIEYAATRNERKADRHRKILVGATVLKVGKKSAKAAGWISDLLKRQNLSERDAEALKPVMDELEQVRAGSKQEAAAIDEAEIAEPVS